MTEIDFNQFRYTLDEIIQSICEYYEETDLPTEDFTNTITTLIKFKKYIKETTK